MVRLAVALLLHVGIGLATAEGSFSAVFDVTALELDVNVEQSVSEMQGGILYAGSGFAVSTAGVEKLQPYLMWCRGMDVFVTYGEVCTELRAPILGPGSILRVFLTAAW